MDPLALLAAAVGSGSLPARILERAKRRLPMLREAVGLVEAASGLTYPPYYVDPVLTLGEGVDGIALLYSRTVPLDVGGRVDILVEFSCPLVLYGSGAVLKAVAAHEFLHYVELVERFMKMRVSSEPFTGHTFEAPYRDLGLLAEPEAILADRRLLRLLKLKFRPNLREEGLDRRVWRAWVEGGLPVRRIRLEENVVRVGVASLLNTRFDERLVERLRGIAGRGPGGGG